MARLVISAGRGLARLAAHTAADALIRRFSGAGGGPPLESLPLLTASDGAPMARLYGRGRITGQVIWAARPRETETGGGKGGPAREDTGLTLSFAIGLCEGEIDGIGRIWANGEPLDQTDLEMRLYTGEAGQLPDALILAVEGPAAPGFRGTAYLVFEDLPLAPFGDRLPNLSVEVFRSTPALEDGPRLEDLVQAINLIPGSGEFAYAVDPVMRLEGPGRGAAENVNNARGRADLLVSLDDLQARLPACRAVQIVLAWFGDDLRCGHCLIRPGVETRDKQTEPIDWSVAGETRASAYQVSTAGDRPVYGGTPDDASVIALIQELKARGFAVTLYPFILMDIPAGNAAPDPHGGAEQAAFPWRGRITCHPAPGQAGSPDGAAAAQDQIAAFFGQAEAADFAIADGAVEYSGPAERRFRRFILHCAALGAAAGGLDGFLIGSEMIGLTRVRGAAGYPAVQELIALAGEARALLGPDCRLSYAADWSEYASHRPDDGSGDLAFHLDPLWSSQEIDAVAIDWYAPLSDWRDGSNHLDAQAGHGPHDRAYFESQVEGGEGGDWYYADPAERAAQTRTPIIDTAHGEDWVFAVKALRDWWGNPHHDRPGGVRAASPTGWAPRSKPIWLTELGLPAVDKGGNQPNVFYDPKSAESALPHFSSGARDDLVQRRALEAVLAYWGDPANNPVSPVYGGAMIDIAATALWAWDARPFPDFPARRDVWADGENWRLGHWLNGRVGLSPLAELVRDLCRQAGVEADVSALQGVLPGYLLDRPGSAREGISPLAALFAFEVAETADGLVFTHLDSPPAFDLSGEDLAYEQGRPVLERRRADPADLPREARLHFLDDLADYQPGFVYARGEAAETARLDVLVAPITSEPGWAAERARAWLTAARSADRTRFILPPCALALEPGDAVRLPGGEVVRLTGLDGLFARRAQGRPGLTTNRVLNGGEPGASGAPLGPFPPPLLVAADLPPLSGEGEVAGPARAAASAPWPGQLGVQVHEAGAPAGPDRAVLARVCTSGRLTTPLPSGPEGRWDEANIVELDLYFGALAAATDRAVLDGANLAAVEGEAGWEVLQFAQAELIAPDHWRLGRLLRARFGTDSVSAGAGARFLLLDSAVGRLPLTEDETGAPLQVRAGLTAIDLSYAAEGRRPLAPCGLSLVREGGALTLSWMRRGRLAAESWTPADIPLDAGEERYEVELLEDGQVLHAAQTAAPFLRLDAALLMALHGGMPQAIEARVRQLSPAAGTGVAAHALLQV